MICDMEFFGANFFGGACFCEAAPVNKHNYCEMGEWKDVGCYLDKNLQDFEEILSSNVESVDECI